MNEEVVQVSIKCDSIPYQYADEFEFISEGYYEWLVLPVIQYYGSPGVNEFDNAVYAYCARDNNQPLYRLFGISFF